MMVRLFSVRGDCCSMAVMDMAGLFRTGFGVVFLARLRSGACFVGSLFHTAMPGCFRCFGAGAIRMMVVMMVLCGLARVCGRRSRQRPAGQNGEARRTGQ
jgi:hypothetical protein